MPSFFFDTSALVKHYIEEIGSDWVTGLVTQPGARNYIASVTGVEMTAALARRSLTQSLTRFETDFVNDYRRLALPESTLDLARQLARQHRLARFEGAPAHLLPDPLPGRERREPLHGRNHARMNKIGRASCRERV